MPISPASKEETQTFLMQYTDWILKENKLHREFQFKNFVEAFSFMTQASVIAELHNHHPEWCNVYNKVVIDLTTHEANGITERDFLLAIEMEHVLHLTRIS